MKNDEQVIKIFSEIIKGGGILHICVPNENRKPYHGEIISEIEDGNHVRLGYSFRQLETMLKENGFEIMGRNTAVGFFAQKSINILNRLQLNLFKNLPNRIRDGLNFIILLPLYPLTFFDEFITAEPLNIYICAKKSS
jgi:hypothetical protein